MKIDITKVLKLMRDICSLQIEELDIKYDILFNRYERIDAEIQWWERFMKYCHTGK
jgi:hypothetical protein